MYHPSLLSMPRVSPLDVCQNTKQTHCAYPINFSVLAENWTPTSNHSRIPTYMWRERVSMDMGIYSEWHVVVWLVYRARVRFVLLTVRSIVYTEYDRMRMCGDEMSCLLWWAFSLYYICILPPVAIKSLCQPCVCILECRIGNWEI